MLSQQGPCREDSVCGGAGGEPAGHGDGPGPDTWGTRLGGGALRVTKCIFVHQRCVHCLQGLHSSSVMGLDSRLQGGQRRQAGKGWKGLRSWDVSSNQTCPIQVRVS